MQDADKHKILDELGGIPEEVYDSLVADLAGQTSDKIAPMREALGTSDWKALVEMAHFIKGSAGNLRLVEIETAARTIENSARAQEDAGLISKQIDSIATQVAALTRV